LGGDKPYTNHGVVWAAQTSTRRSVGGDKPRPYKMVYRSYSPPNSNVGKGPVPSHVLDLEAP